MLYNDMRPKTFSEVSGQENMMKILKECLEKDNVPSALLFVGTRGTGKTTVARILAKRVNCEHPDGIEPCCKCDACKSITLGQSQDVLELDAASHNGVDDVRELLKLISFEPLLQKRVVILDEVHMLSSGAFNALLKALEEPPRDVIFILCTTELQKIPATILSRCRKISFNTISTDKIVERLREVNQLLSLKAEDEALEIVATAAEGSMRDALSIYEGFINGDSITSDWVRKCLGLTSKEMLFSLLRSLKNCDVSGILGCLETVTGGGNSLKGFAEELMRLLLKILSFKHSGDLSLVSSEFEEEFLEISSLPDECLFRYLERIRSVVEIKGNLYSYQSAFLGLLCEENRIDTLENRISLLEEQLLKGVVPCSSEQPASPLLAEKSPVLETSPSKSEEFCYEQLAEHCLGTDIPIESMEISDEELAKLGFLVESGVASSDEMGEVLEEKPKSDSKQSQEEPQAEPSEVLARQEDSTGFSNLFNDFFSV